LTSPDTIAAITTPKGFGGVGVIRLSGPAVQIIAEEVLEKLPPPRQAKLAWFRDHRGEAIDQGLALFFPAPHSFTGEDVLELQGHGGPMVLDLVLRRLVELGARLARPGEFSERAFLNGKLDLAQAEAIADLIESGTETAARLARRTLSGDFSRRLYALIDELIRLRTYLEAGLDFPEEEIDFLADSTLGTAIGALLSQLEAVLASAQQGCLVREGLRAVIAGPPNVGKSSLLNALTGSEAAIVTDIPGTTRDLLHREIQIDGLPLHLTDTAGMHSSDDLVEQEGIRRARQEIAAADAILWVSDDSRNPDTQAFNLSALDLPTGSPIPMVLIRNKVDLTGRKPGLTRTAERVEIALSAREGLGIEFLREHLKELAGYQGGEADGIFMARRRHLDALNRALTAMREARANLQQQRSGEFIAEDLRQAQQALGEITGEFTTEDLLERIFTSFCIGK
jgi:tRNA modification GTPase